MPRCKHCKEKFEAIHFNQKYCTKKECMDVWIKKAKQVQWKAKKRRMKEELRTTSDYVKEAQKWVNKFVRLRDKDKNCISCDAPLTGKFDAGHFFSAGGHGSVRFDVRNIHAQCVYCNQWEHGNLYQYHIRLLTKIGLKEFEDLEKQSKKMKKWEKDELKDIIKLYKQKCKEIENNS
tara:strand:- start:530 stop:1060 length:531 start_codon:yes stop_codon:yes gene_type:complete